MKSSFQSDIRLKINSIEHQTKILWSKYSDMFVTWREILKFCLGDAQAKIPSIWTLRVVTFFMSFLSLWAFELQGQNFIFFYFLSPIIRTPKILYFLTFEWCIFSAIFDFFSYFFSFYFKPFGVHISRRSLDMNLYNFVRSFQ